MTFATTDSGIKALGMFLCSHVARPVITHFLLMELMSSWQLFLSVLPRLWSLTKICR